MKKLFMALTLVLFVTSFSFSQINKNWDGTIPEVYSGSKGFVFYYAPFVSSNLGAVYAGSRTIFQDTANTNIGTLYGVGFQYYVTKEIALAIGFNFNSWSWEPTWSGVTSKQSSSSFGVSLDGNYHFKSLYSVSPYLGLNVNFGTGSNSWQQTVGSTTSKYETSGNSIGFGLNFGFDWYFTPGLSLGGRYTVKSKIQSETN